MKTIYSRYDKNKITDLPTEAFVGRVIVVLTESEAEKAVDYLLSAPVLGVDSETRPSFQRGQRNKVALLQVSTHDTCFLFRLNQLGLCPAVVRLLEDTTVPKIGLSWHDDLRMLHGRGEFTPGLFVELQKMIAEIGVSDLGLQKIYANLFEKKLSKRQRLTNWEAPILTDAQKEYAALDAQACVKIYNEINRLKESGDYELIVVPEPENPQRVLTDEERKEKLKRKRARHSANKKARKAAEKKAAEKKPRAKKSVEEKPVEKKSRARKTNVEKPAEKKPRAKKTTTTKTKKTAKETTEQK